MSDPLWSVELVIGHNEQVALDHAGTRVVGPEKYMVVRPWEDGPSTFHLDVSAPTAEEAQEQALQIYAEIRAAAQLAPDDAPAVLTVARVAGAPHAWDRHIFAAEDMLEERRYALAVVSAQIHCEMYIRHALDTAAKHAGPPIAALAPSLLRSCALTDRLGPEVFKALLGVDPTSAPCWRAYKTHVDRRGSVVHQGTDVTEDLAEQSMEAAVAMVRFVDDALRTALQAG